MSTVCRDNAGQLAGMASVRDRGRVFIVELTN